MEMGSGGLRGRFRFFGANKEAVASGGTGLAMFGGGRLWLQKSLNRKANFGRIVRALRNRNARRKKTSYWRIIDALDFKKILILWLGYILLFGLFFFALDIVSPQNGLRYVELGADVISFLNALYFSFVCATSTGFGDITPLGLSRTVAITEVVGGMLLFGLVISKLISFKQDMILDEIYEISLDEKVGGLRSRLYLFRSDLVKLIERIVEGQTFKRRVDGLWSSFDVLAENLRDIEKIICLPNGRRSEFLKTVGPLQLELILNSIVMSLDRVSELLTLVSEKEYNWRSEKNTKSLHGVLEIVNSIGKYYENSPTPEAIKNRVDELVRAGRELERQLGQ